MTHIMSLGQQPHRQFIVLWNTVAIDVFHGRFI